MENTSLFGCLFAYYPAELLDKNDPLIQGTLQLVETRQKSEGGLPLGTGWIKEGLWVAMALDNYGLIDFNIENKDDEIILIDLSAERDIDVPIEFHIRLPFENYTLEAVKNDCEILSAAGGSITVLLQNNARKLSLVVNVKIYY